MVVDPLPEMINIHVNIEIVLRWFAIEVGKRSDPVQVWNSAGDFEQWITRVTLEATNTIKELFTNH